MPDSRKWFCLVLLLVSAASALAQTGQALPEIDTYFGLHDNVRVWVQAKETREAGAPVTSEIGPSIDFYVYRNSLLRKITHHNNDDSQARPAVFTVGYRILPYPGASPTNRLEPVLTLNVPVPHVNFLVSDRNRFDFDWNSGSFVWRYRNRIKLQRTWAIRSFNFSPYAMAEFFYESQYSKWADTALYAGCDFPIGRHFSLSPYYEHQNQTGQSPNQQLNQAGIIWSIYIHSR